MRYLYLIIALLSLLPRPAKALDKSRYDLEFLEIVEPHVKTRSMEGNNKVAAALLQWIDRPETTERQRYLAWRRIALSFIYSPWILNGKDRERLSAQKPADDDLLFQLSQTFHQSGVALEEKRRLLDKIFERALLEFPNTDVPALAADALADFHIFNDNPLDAIITLEKGLKTLDKQAGEPRYYLFNHLAILYTDAFQSDENIRKGIAIYKELESNDRDLMHFNQGVAWLFGLNDFKKAAEAFQSIQSNDRSYDETLPYFAAALLGLNRRDEALAKIQEFDRSGFDISSERMIFLNCTRAIVLYELNQTQDLKACDFVSDHYYSSAIDVVMLIQSLVQRPLPPATEFQILKNFRQYFLTKFRHRIKNSTARTISHLELERSRLDKERLRFEAELERKSSQMKSIVLYSSGLVMLILVLAMWRVWWKNRRIEALQQYIKVNILQRFLPEALIKEILQGRSRLEEEPQKKMITILFADLVEFSATTEALGTDGIARLLNAYLKTMTEVVFQEGGTIDKFIGDAVMVIFGAPFESPPEDQMQRAVRCAERMFQALDALNETWREEFGTTFELRIGINSGEAIVGSFGSDKRSDYTVIGSAVNMASRIEALAPPGRIVVSRASAAYLHMKGCESLGYFHLKGVRDDQELFQVVTGDASSHTENGMPMQARPA